MKNALCTTHAKLISSAFYEKVFRFYVISSILAVLTIRII